MIKTLASKTIFTGSVLTLVQDRVQLPSGQKTTREVIKHPGAVVILALTDENKLLLVDQYRYPMQKNLLEFPAGTLEADEQPLACAKREIIEETGFAAASMEYFGELYPTPGFCDEIQQLFIARGLTKAEQNLDEDEIIEVKMLSVQEFEQAVASGEILDAKTIASYFKARQLGKI